MNDNQTTLKKSIGLFLKNKRQEKNYSLAQLSILIYGNKWSKANLSQIENGKVSTDIDTLEKISLALGFNLSETFNNI